MRREGKGTVEGKKRKGKGVNVNKKKIDTLKCDGKRDEAT